MDAQQTPQQNIFDIGGQFSLPNATAVLVLGIVSIPTCCCYGIVGLICGIIAMVLYRKDMALYLAAPGNYTQSSYKNLKAGQVCAIIGISLSALYMLMLIILISISGISALNDPATYQKLFSH